MVQQVISTGTGPNTGTGDPGFTAWTKANANFTELYSIVGGGIGSFLQLTVGPPPSGSALTVNGGTASDAVVINEAADTTGLTINVSGILGPQDLLITGNNNKESIIRVTNLANGTVSGAGLQFTNSASHFWSQMLTAPGWTGSLMVGAPLGEQYGQWTTGALPFSVGTNSIERMRISAAGNVAVNAPASGTALTVNGIAATTTMAVVAVGTTGIPDLNVTGSINRSVGSVTSNSLVGTLSAAVVSAINDASHGATMGVTSTGWSGPLLTGGPSGEQAFIYAFGSTVPLIFGTGNTYRGQINSAGNWSIAAPTSGVPLTIGAGATQYVPLIGLRNAGADVEFGHPNAAGFGSVIGAESSSGKPYIALCAGPGTTANTYRTFGNPGRVIQADLAGGMVTGRITTASADNQSITQDLAINGNGNVTIAAPTSGNALSVSAQSGQRAMTIQGAGAGIALSMTTGTTLGLYIDNTTNGAGNPAIRVDVSATTGTATPTGLGTVKPGAATAASQWLPISINGTTMYIPLWL
jgi:hypothetical protein